MTSRPRRKQLRARVGRCPVARLWAICGAGSWVNWGLGCSTSAWQPTLMVQKGTTARASQSRSARAGASILVCSPCQPPRVLSFEPALDPGAQPIPRDIAGGRRQGGEEQPGVAIPGIPACQEGACELPCGGGAADDRASPPLPDTADHLRQRTTGGGGGHPIVALTIDAQEGMPAQRWHRGKQPAGVQATVGQHQHRPVGGHAAL